MQVLRAALVSVAMAMAASTAGCTAMASDRVGGRQLFTTEPYVQAEQAIRRDDAARLRELIEAGLDVDHQSEVVRTAWGRDTVHLLLYATVLDKVRAVEALLEAGADVNKATRGGMTAMIMGAPSPSEALFELLLVRYKADPNAVLRIGVEKSPLMFLLQERRALGEKRFERARRLLQHGARVDLDLGGGETAAITFSNLDDWRAVRWLLENGARHETRGRVGTIMCYMRVSYLANALAPTSEHYAYRDRVRDWLLERGVARSRVDPALHPSPKCDD